MTALEAALGELELPSDLQAPLRGFVSLFQKWNEKINLSAARREREIIDQVIDCLHLVPHLRTALAAHAAPEPPHVLDVGAGGGLPAAVVALVMPALQVTALEPVHKKHAFLRTVARDLGLRNLEPLAVRLEAHARSDYAAAMSRATFDLRDWLVMGLDRVEPEGIVFGFEAVTRADLPPGTLRYPYSHLDRTRAIVALRRAPDADPRARAPASRPRDAS